MRPTKEKVFHAKYRSAHRNTWRHIYTVCAWFIRAQPRSEWRTYNCVHTNSNSNWVSFLWLRAAAKAFSCKNVPNQWDDKPSQYIVDFNLVVQLEFTNSIAINRGGPMCAYLFTGLLFFFLSKKCKGTFGFDFMSIEVWLYIFSVLSCIGSFLWFHWTERLSNGCILLWYDCLLLFGIYDVIGEVKREVKWWKAMFIICDIYVTGCSCGLLVNSTLVVYWQKWAVSLNRA